MSRSVPEHGTMARRLGCMSRPACLCLACLEGARKRRKVDDLRRSRGVSGMTLTRPAAVHVRRLIQSGRSISGISRESGIHPKTIRRVLNETSEEIWRTTADKLLALPPIPDDAALVDSTGTVRRLRALVVMGHSQKTLADEVGCAFTYISMLTHDQRDTVTSALERAVQRTYAKLSMQVGSSVYGRARAASYGWYGPLAWDDDTIDDPRAVPQTDALQPAFTDGENVAARWLMGEAVILGQDDRREVLQHLFEWTNDTIAEIAERLDMTPKAAEQAWMRLKKKSALEGRRVWRRVYVPRERTLMKNQMEEAA